MVTRKRTVPHASPPFPSLSGTVTVSHVWVDNSPFGNTPSFQTREGPRRGLGRDNRSVPGEAPGGWGGPEIPAWVWSSHASWHKEGHALQGQAPPSHHKPLWPAHPRWQWHRARARRISRLGDITKTALWESSSISLGSAVELGLRAGRGGQGLLHSLQLRRLQVQTSLKDPWSGKKFGGKMQLTSSAQRLANVTEVASAQRHPSNSKAGARLQTGGVLPVYWGPSCSRVSSSRRGCSVTLFCQHRPVSLKDLSTAPLVLKFRYIYLKRSQLPTILSTVKGESP